jgi:glutamate---cysteine ligase / carboxylate-amine ligase
MTSIGIEEEFLLVGRGLMVPVAPTNHQTNMLQEITARGGVASQEWLSCQVEHVSSVFQNAGTATSALLTFRRKLSSVAGDFDMIAAALGTAPSIGERSAAVSDDARYLHMTELAPAIAADQYINGMHVHVGVPDPETGVQALNGIRPWLPLLTALGSNSPFWRGRDSGFDSWRSIHYRRWMVNGVPPHFHDFTDYQTRVETLLGTDVVAGHAGICWLARLPESHPTIEVRACDVQLQTLEAVVLAALIRALVCAAIDQPPSQQPEPELLDVAHWQAAKFGLRGRLLDPFTGAPQPAEVVVWQAFNHAWPYLQHFGDVERVHSGLKLLLTHGNGATRQRAVYQQAGIEGVLRYAERAMDELKRDPAPIAPQYDALRAPAKLGLG